MDDTVTQPRVGAMGSLFDLKADAEAHYKIVCEKATPHGDKRTCPLWLRHNTSITGGAVVHNAATGAGSGFAHAPS